MAQEKKLQDFCLKFCKDNSILALKIDSTSCRGIPDILCLLPNGTTLFLEMKAPKGKVSALQERMISKINKQNGNAYVIRSKEEFLALIEEFTH